MVNRPKRTGGSTPGWFASVLVIALFAFGVLAPSAIGLSYGMDGKWKSEHRFGKPTLNLNQHRRANYVEGTYSGGQSTSGGEIWGPLEHAGDHWVWEGKYQNNGPNQPKGKFRLRVFGLGSIHNAENDSFEGWFKSCDFNGACSHKHHWEGEHVR